MKTLLNLLKAGLLAFLPLLLHSHLGIGTGGGISVALPPLVGLFDGNTLAILGTALYWLELVIRVIPTASSFTPLTLIIQLLQAIVPNQAVSPSGTPGVHEPTSFFRRLFYRHEEAQSGPEYTEAEPLTPPAIVPVANADLVAAVLAHLQGAGLTAASAPFISPNVPLA